MAVIADCNFDPSCANFIVMQGEIEQIANMMPKGTKKEVGLLEHLE